jgi:N-acetylglucosamine malate deacetylase 1
MNSTPQKDRSPKLLLRRLAQQVSLTCLQKGLSRPIVASDRSAIVFTPHADDETLGCGGMIAQKRQQGAQIDVVFLTDCSGSHPNHPRISPPALSQIRKQEAIAAVTTLGVTPTAIHFLDLPDGGLAELSAIQVESAVGRLSQLITDLHPAEVYLPFRRDLHLDHEASHRLVRSALQHSGLMVETFQYPIWMVTAPWRVDFKMRELANLYRLAIAPVLGQKRTALQCYQSQCLPIPPETHASLDAEFLSLFSSPYELYFKLPAPDLYTANYR